MATIYQVTKAYFRSGDDAYLSEGYPITDATKEEAEARLERIRNGDPREFGGWMNADGEELAELYVATIHDV